MFDNIKASLLTKIYVIIGLLCLPTLPIRSEVVDPCDVYAADPEDTQKIAKGIWFEKLILISERAVSACSIAVNVYRTEPRYQYQLARALAAARKEDEAISLLRKAAKLGYPAAMRQLGQIALARPAEEGKGLELLEAAKSKGDVAATVYLAVYEFNPSLVDSMQGNAFNRSQVKKFSPSEQANLENLFRQLKVDENASAQLALAIVYYYSERPSIHNLGTARRYALLASLQGHSKAMALLGMTYIGDDITSEPNMKEAVKWFKESADNGSALAALQIGMLYPFVEYITTEDLQFAQEIFKKVTGKTSTVFESALRARSK